MKDFIRKALLLTPLCLSAFHPAFAQRDSAKNDVFGAFVTFPIEVPFIDNAELNERLIAAGYPECRYPSAALGIGVQFHVRNLMVIFSYNKTTRRPKSDNEALEVEYRATTFGLGYDVLRSPFFLALPLCGL